MSVSKSAFQSTSSRPRMATVYDYEIPFSMQIIPQWCAWRWGKRRNGDDTWAKIPFYWPIDKRGRRKHIQNARSNDLTTVGEYWDIIPKVVFNQSMVDNNGPEPWIGLMFLLTEESGIVCVDLDDSRNRETGELTPEAAEIVRRLNSYTEISPSGTGLKIYVKAKKPGPRCKNTKLHYDVEIYSDKRFVALTGERYPGTPDDLQERQEEITAIYSELFPEQEATDTAEQAERRKALEDWATGRQFRGMATATGTPADATDQQLLDRIFNASNGATVEALFNGVRPSNDRSAADFSLASHLAFWCGPDPDRILRLMLQSSLHHKKWTRPDYLPRTIARAIDRQTRFYGDSLGLGQSRRRAFTPSDPTEAEEQRRREEEHKRKQREQLERIFSQSPELVERNRKHVEEWKRANDAREAVAAKTVERINNSQREKSCPNCTRLIHVNQDNTETYIRWRACDSWGCSACKVGLIKKWKVNATLRFTELKAGEKISSALVPAEKFNSVRVKIKRHGGNYLVIYPFGDDSHEYYVFTDCDALEKFEGATEHADAKAATDRFFHLLDSAAFASGSRLCSSSKGWQIPKREKAEARFKMVGVIPQRCSDRWAKEIPERMGGTIEDVTPRDRRPFQQVWKISHLAHAGPEWIDELHDCLKRGTSPQKFKAIRRDDGYGEWIQFEHEQSEREQEERRLERWVLGEGNETLQEILMAGRN